MKSREKKISALFRSNITRDAEHRLSNRILCHSLQLLLDFFLCPPCPKTFYPNHQEFLTSKHPAPFRGHKPRARKFGGGSGLPAPGREGVKFPLFSGHRTTPQATTSPADPDRVPLRGSGPARASPREGDPVRVPGRLTLSGVSLATPRRTQARQVTWRLRFMVVGDNASQAGGPYCPERRRQVPRRGGRRAGTGARLTSPAGAVGRGAGDLQEVGVVVSWRR